jgi:hypothetical protein
VKKTLLVAAAVLATAVMTAPAALAEDTGPDTSACAKARIAEGEALAAFRTAEKAEKDFRNAAKDGTGAVEGTDKVTGISQDEQTKLDALAGTSLRLDEALDKAVDKRKDKCDEPDPTTTPATPTTVIDDPDVDCDEVTASRAQEILDADRADPNNLDTDNDGVACEEDVVLNPPPTVNVVVPNGGVATGGGPA